jgi:hypothetical protein
MDGLYVGNTFPLYSCAIAMVTIKRVLVIIAHGVVVWRLFMVINNNNNNLIIGKH